MLHASIYVVHLRRLKLDTRLAELDISPCYPLNVIKFAIDQRGVIDVNDEDDKKAHLRRRI
jgi:hypothetical protein